MSLKLTILVILLLLVLLMLAGLVGLLYSDYTRRKKKDSSRLREP